VLVRVMPSKGGRKVFKQAVLGFLVKTYCLMAFDNECHGFYISTLDDEIYRCCPHCFTHLPSRRVPVREKSLLFSRERD